MPRVTFSVQGGNQAVAAKFTRKGSAAREAAVRFTNDHGLAHYDALYAETPLRKGRMRRLLRLESTRAGLGYRTGFLAADWEAEGQYPYFYVVLFGNLAGTIVGDDYMSPINRQYEARYRTGLPAAIRAATRRA